MTYLLEAAKDPPHFPPQGRKGGTFNSQLHPAFWVSMAVCDDPPIGGLTREDRRHRPELSAVGPDSDRNIFDGTKLQNERDLHRQASGYWIC